MSNQEAEIIIAGLKELEAAHLHAGQLAARMRKKLEPKVAPASPKQPSKAKEAEMDGRVAERRRRILAKSAK